MVILFNLLRNLKAVFEDDCLTYFSFLSVFVQTFSKFHLNCEKPN